MGPLLKVTQDHSPLDHQQIETAHIQTLTVAPPFTSVNGDGEVWSNSPGPQGTVFSPQQGFYFIELLTNDASANDGSYWNERTIGTNPNYDRIMVIENVYPNRTYNIEYYP